MHKIYNLSKVFRCFKKTILLTSEIKIPKTTQDTKDVLVEVMSEVNCAINYINHYLIKANLFNSDKI